MVISLPQMICCVFGLGRHVLHGEVDALVDEFVAAEMEQGAGLMDGFEGVDVDADGDGFGLIGFGEEMGH